MRPGEVEDALGYGAEGSDLRASAAGARLAAFATAATS